MLCVGDGTGSTGNGGDTGGSVWGGGWQCCAQGCCPAVPSLCTGDSRVQTTPLGWHTQEQAPGGPVCFWVQSQWLLAQGGQVKAVLDSGSSAGGHRMH